MAVQNKQIKIIIDYINATIDNIQHKKILLLHYLFIIF